ncbi:hypothetical protein ACTXQV_37770, partial [Klebsiella pneumoniae]
TGFSEYLRRFPKDMPFELVEIPAGKRKEPELAKAWIFANLLAAFLIDDIIQPSLDFPPRSAGSEKKN